MMKNCATRMFEAAWPWINNSAGPPHETSYAWLLTPSRSRLSTLSTPVARGVGGAARVADEVIGLYAGGAHHAFRKLLLPA